MHVFAMHTQLFWDAATSVVYLLANWLTVEEVRMGQRCGEMEQEYVYII